MDTMALNGNWDLYIDPFGNIAVNTNGEALAQDAASAIKTFQGEVYYDTTLGIPYWTTILGKLPSLSVIRALMVQAAKAVPGVVKAACFFTGFVNRRWTGQVQITDNTNTTFGTNF